MAYTIRKVDVDYGVSSTWTMLSKAREKWKRKNMGVSSKLEPSLAYPTTFAYQRLPAARRDEHGAMSFTS